MPSQCTVLRANQPFQSLKLIFLQLDSRLLQIGDRGTERRSAAVKGFWRARRLAYRLNNYSSLFPLYLIL
jgi:hypothetical protein